MPGIVSRVARRSSGRTGSPGKQKLWSALLSDNGLISTSLITFSLMDGADWERSSSTTERATVVRIRGNIAITQVVAASSYYVGIAVVDKDDSTFDPSSPAGAVDFAPMWLYTWTSGAGVSNSTWSIDVDIKAKRKMTNSDRIVVVETATVTNSFRTGYILRALALVA